MEIGRLETGTEGNKKTGKIGGTTLEGGPEAGAIDGIHVFWHLNLELKCII